MNASERPDPYAGMDALDSTQSFAAHGLESEHSADAAVDQQQAFDALPAGTALLVVQRGPNSGARFLLDTDQTTVGRDPKCSIFLDDVTVSRNHAQFTATARGFQVRDVGSLNGTYVNRTRVDQADLMPGDEVQIGKYRLTYHPSAAEPGGTP